MAGRSVPGPPRHHAAADPLAHALLLPTGGAEERQRQDAQVDCAPPRPPLVRVRDPFAKLLARIRAFSAYLHPGVVGARGGAGKPGE